MRFMLTEIETNIRYIYDVGQNLFFEVHPNGKVYKADTATVSAETRADLVHKSSANILSEYITDNVFNCIETLCETYTN